MTKALDYLGHPQIIGTMGSEFKMGYSYTSHTYVVPNITLNANRLKISSPGKTALQTEPNCNDPLITHFGIIVSRLPSPSGTTTGLLPTSKSNTDGDSDRITSSTPGTVGISVGSVVGGIGLMVFIFVARVWVGRRKAKLELHETASSPSFYSRPVDPPQRAPRYDGTSPHGPLGNVF